MEKEIEPQLERILFSGGAAGGRLPRRLLHASSDAVLDLLYPPHCVSCDAGLPEKTNKSLCRGCAERIRWFGADRCDRCGDAVGRGRGVVRECPSCKTHPPAYVRSACSVAGYAEGPLRDMILALKFGLQTHVTRLMGQLIAQRIRDTQILDGNAALVPAPLTRESYLKRGFNQAEEIARCVSRETGIPVETRLLKKVRATPPQATLTAEQRRTNLKGAFACDPKVAARYKDKRVLLIDDVITTGSTISECARTLAAAGTGEVRAASMARG